MHGYVDYKAKYHRVKRRKKKTTTVFGYYCWHYAACYS